MEEESKSYLIDNWDHMPRDLRILILQRMPEEDRFATCQINKKISDFCRKNNLTADDETIRRRNPHGILIDTKRKQVDLIKRGFQTVFSLILSESEVKDRQEDFETNIPTVKEIELVELVFGVNRGTMYYMSDTANDDAIDQTWRFHLGIPGLPPVAGELIKVVFFVQFDWKGDWDFKALIYKDDDDLLLKIDYEHEESEGTSDATMSFYKTFLSDEKNFIELLEKGRYERNRRAIIIASLPCP